MTWDAIANIFQGVTTLVNSFSHDPKMAIARIGLIGLGLLLIYMGKKGYLEALLMIPNASAHMVRLLRLTVFETVRVMF